MTKWWQLMYKQLMNRQLIAFVTWACCYSAAECGVTLNPIPGVVPVTDTMVVSTTLMPPEDATGFQLNLIITPDGGSSGTVGFNSVAKPASNYILGMAGAFTPSITTTTTTDDSALAFDSTFAAVSLMGGENLASLTFTPSGGASGSFGLYAFDQAGKRTHWLDESGMAMQFVGLPKAGAGMMTQLRIGTISTTAVPEPSALAYVLVPTFALCSWKFYLRWRKRTT